MIEKKLLVPVDYSDGSRRALEYAGVLADRMKRELVVLYAWECMPQPGRDLEVQTAQGTCRSLFDLIQENAEIDMCAFLADTKLPQAVHLKYKIVSGEPSRRIVEAAQSGAYELVVIGTHGQSGFKRFVIGSVAERVVRASPIPVITVPSASL